MRDLVTDLRKTPGDLQALRNAAADRIEVLEAALHKIASCEKRADGDVVDIAKKALK